MAFVDRHTQALHLTKAGKSRPFTAAKLDGADTRLESRYGDHLTGQTKTYRSRIVALCICMGGSQYGNQVKRAKKIFDDIVLVGP